MLIIKNKSIFLYILLFSFFVLLAAYFIQYILNHKPCNLCLFERLPYFLSILLILFLFIVRKYEKIILKLLLFLFLFGFVVSFYHFGIEQGFFSESLVCDLGNTEKTLSTDELLKQLETKTISCKIVTFNLFGLSLATFNTVISLIISVIIIKNLNNYEKN
ncbi:disulfide bond formation protein B [Pelagibacteraceae bacterium]|jgi:disulfide bond formation protein DsbB|nr:disulfide bond formation protein B [Pelagibacteraceae bacterium]|tara:strand:+ start:4511 stop:4993 length:483 start_codon:yes stop_codon:yes gene_type:complete